MGDLGSIPGLGRSSGEGKGYPFQYSGLENSMDCIVHGVSKSQTWLGDFHFHLSPKYTFKSQYSSRITFPPSLPPTESLSWRPACDSAENSSLVSLPLAQECVGAPLIFQSGSKPNSPNNTNSMSNSSLKPHPVPPFHKDFYFFPTVLWTQGLFIFAYLLDFKTKLKAILRQTQWVVILLAFTVPMEVCVTLSRH